MVKSDVDYRFYPDSDQDSDSDSGKETVECDECNDVISVEDSFSCDSNSCTSHCWCSTCYEEKTLEIQKNGTYYKYCIDCLKGDILGDYIIQYNDTMKMCEENVVLEGYVFLNERLSKIPLLLKEDFIFECKKNVKQITQLRNDLSIYNVITEQHRDLNITDVCTLVTRFLRKRKANDIKNLIDFK